MAVRCPGTASTARGTADTVWETACMPSVLRSKPPGASAIVTALIYTRVSSDEQAREGLSLDAQLTECRRYAAHKGWLLGTEYQDILTGTRDDRPQYQRLLSDIRALSGDGANLVVVVAALDRFGRQLLERVRCREELKRLGVTVHSVREGGEVSDLVANILASVAEEEVRRLGERVRASKQYVIANGYMPQGAVKWGYILRPATEAERAAGAPKTMLDINEQTAPYVRGSFSESSMARLFVRQPGGSTVSRPVRSKARSSGSPPCNGFCGPRPTSPGTLR
jgi:DNA invertase Pin-like site-specific DNA recombinase